VTLLPERIESQVVKGRQFYTPVVIGFVLVALYLPSIIWLIRTWLDDPQYSHGFLILPVSAFIVWTRRKELVSTKPLVWGAAVLAIGFLAYVLGFIWRIYWVLTYSFLIVAFGLLLYFRGTRAARSMLFPICFLVFMIPLPNLYLLSTFMQSISACWSVAIVHWTGIPATRTGAEVHLSQSAFTIGTPCSGMNTLISLLALAALFLYFLKAPFYKKACLFLLAFPIAILANVFRITLLLLVANQWGAEAALGFLHGFSNLLLFLIALLLLLLLSRLWGCSFHRVKNT
jgi:exosortase